MPRPFVIALVAAPLMLAACTPGDTSSGATGTPTPADANATRTSPPTPGTPVTGGEPASTASATPEAGDPCGASKVRDRWLNALPSDDAKAAIATAVGERRIRYYTAGDPITMDYSEERLNVVLGKDGRIMEFRCG